MLDKDKIYLIVISKKILTSKACILIATVTGTLNLCFSPQSHRSSGFAQV